LKLQIKIDGKTYEAEVEVLEEDAGQSGNGSDVSDSATGQSMPAPGAYTPGHVADVHSADEKLYRSPVNGLAIKVNVVPGQQIQPNDVLTVLEAMKMETSVTAHHAGKVKKVNVAPGKPVKLHEVLIELE
jgi:methylmalonyl-CoA carboxyltransferase small subunit